MLPNWHPVFVHFTVGLLSTSVLFVVASHFIKDKKAAGRISGAGLWMLWAGALFTLVTAGTGFYAFATVAHDDPSHLAMKDHRLWALITVGVFIFLAGYSFLKDRKGRPLPSFFSPALVAGAVLLAITGYKGGELVYRHGLGVLSLPEAEGEDHSHEDGEGHEEASVDILEPNESTAVTEDVMSDKEKIKNVLADFVAAWNANDPEKAALVYTDPHYDVNATPQKETRQETVEKFRKYYDAFETTVEVTSDEIIIFGDQAVQRGEFILTSTPRKGGDTEFYTRRYIEVLKKDENGNWAVYWGIDGPPAGQ